LGIRGAASLARRGGVRIRQHFVPLFFRGHVEDAPLRHWPFAGVASRSPYVARGPCGRPAFGSGLSISPSGFAAIAGVSHFAMSLI